MPDVLETKDDYLGVWKRKG